MHGPPLVGWLLVVIASATGISCLLRTGAGCAASPTERDLARAEGVMGLGMGLMAVPGSVLDQQPWGATLFAVVFGIAALRSLRPARRHPHHLHHAVSAAAMVYMAVAMAAMPTAHGAGLSGMSGMSGMDQGGAGVPLLTGLLLCYFAAYTLWAGLRLLPTGQDRVAPAGTVTVSAVGPPWALQLTAACRLSMGIGMFAMLLVM